MCHHAKVETFLFLVLSRCIFFFHLKEAFSSFLMMFPWEINFDNLIKRKEKPGPQCAERFAGKAVSRDKALEFCLPRGISGRTGGTWGLAGPFSEWEQTMPSISVHKVSIIYSKSSPKGLGFE